MIFCNTLHNLIFPETPHENWYRCYKNISRVQQFFVPPNEGGRLSNFFHNIPTCLPLKYIFFKIFPAAEGPQKINFTPHPTLILTYSLAYPSLLHQTWRHHTTVFLPSRRNRRRQRCSRQASLSAGSVSRRAGMTTKDMRVRGGGYPGRSTPKWGRSGRNRFSSTPERPAECIPSPGLSGKSPSCTIPEMS